MKALALMVCLISTLASAQSDPEYDRLFGSPSDGGRPKASVGAPAEAQQEAKPEPEGGGWFSMEPWSVAHEDLGSGRHRLRFELATLHTGADGEVRMRVARWAAAMVRRNGLAGYEIARLEEGVESGWFFAQRYAEVEVRFIASETFGVF